jgi:hypothetical protein
MSRTGWLLVGGAGIAAALLIAFLLFGRAPAAPRPEDGIFANDCCGTVTLDRGRLVVGGQKIRYEIGRDEKGAFLLPDTYVGPYEDRGFEVDGTTPALKIRPDALPRPTSLALEAYGKVFVFKRERPRPR